MPDKTEDGSRMSRRDFLTKGALAAFSLAMGGAVVGGVVLPKPPVSPGPTRRYKLGAPEEFPVGTGIKIDSGSFFLFRDDAGFSAITSVCTHLGCIVTKADNGFSCPCHGSQFSAEGKVIGGPAPRALPWLNVSLTPDGKLMVDADKEVAQGTKLAV